MKCPSNCDSMQDLKEYISEEKPYVEYCIIEVDTTNYEDDTTDEQTSEEIDIPISQGMRSYLVEWCDDLMSDEGDIGLFVVDDAMLHDLQYIAELSQIPFDWKELRQKLKTYNSKPAHLILN